MKRFIAILLCALMVVPQAVVGTLAFEAESEIFNEAVNVEPVDTQPVPDDVVEPRTIVDIQVHETRPLMEGTYGWDQIWTDEFGVEHNWFRYSPSDAVVTMLVTFDDGTSEIHDKSFMSSWRTFDDQSYDNQWSAGNTYPASIEYNGIKFSFEVSIVEPTPFEYFVQDGGAYITGVKDNWFFESITDFVIPAEIHGYPVVGVTSMNGWCNNVKTITIPASVIHLSDWAFQEFFNVETVYIEGTETYLEPLTFFGMNSVKEFVLNEDHVRYTEIDGVIFDKEVTTIKAYPIAKGNTYVLPETISDLSFKSFYREIDFIINPDSTEFFVENGITYNKDKTQIISCDKTVSGDYVMPDTVESIAAMLFEECDNLTSIKISSKVTEIAYATFAGCDNLKTVILPENLTSIGEYAFAECTALESAELPSTLLNIQSRAFVDTALKSVTIPGSLCFIGDRCFVNSKIETLTIEDATHNLGVDIAYSAFENNRNLKTAVIGEGLVYLGSNAFRNCVSLESINIPDSLRSGLGSNIFENCDSLTYLPIGANQDHISASEFYDCDGLVNIVIPDQITVIMSRAFSDCSNLKTAKLPDNLTYLEDYIFSNCTSLTELPLSASQTYIAYGEFSGCTGLINVEFPERIRSIGCFAFSYCSNLESVNFSDKINFIDCGAFLGCTALKYAYIGKYVKQINMSTFKNSGITEVVIGNNVQHIGYEAFMNSKLTSVDIPASVTGIAYFSFFGCEDLVNINMPDTLIKLGGHSFGGTKWYNNKREGMVYLGTSLYGYKGDITEETELYVKPGTLAIAGHALENGCCYSESWAYESDNRYLAELYDRSGLRAIHIPEGVEVIGECAFYDCSALSKIYLPASLTAVCEDAFYMVNLETIYFGGTEEQWNAIIVQSGNSALNRCEVVFNYVDGQYPEMPDTTLNGWIFGKDSKWYFYENDKAVIGEWRKDTHGWCYLGNDGAMVTNTWVMDSKGWCYIGANGYTVTNCWKRDSVGWCYLDGEGSQVKNSWILDGGLWYFIDAAGYMMSDAWIYEPNGWVYLGENGAMVINKWVKDSVGWVYLDNNGYMVTNRWVRDSIGWCYVGANGYAVTNCWKQDSQGWCYLNSEGSMTINSWVNDGGVWYYLNANGYMLSNTWLELGGTWYYFNAGGAMVTGWQFIGGVWYNFASSGAWIG